MSEIEAMADELVDAALNATVPGGSNVWVWLPQKDAWTPHQTARDVMRCAITAALAALRETHHLIPKDQEPDAWRHTLHMELEQTYERLLDHDGTDCDDPRRTGFGVPGRDYSEEYEVTSIPLYALEKRHD
jgi:hypothetical protein